MTFFKNRPTSENFFGIESSKTTTNNRDIKQRKQIPTRLKKNTQTTKTRWVLDLATFNKPLSIKNLQAERSENDSGIEKEGGATLRKQSTFAPKCMPLS